MAKHIKDTAYLSISTRVRALENGLLTRERLDQVLDAPTIQEAVKLLREWGYPELDAARPEDMDAALSAVREAAFSDVADGVPDSRYLDIFKLKYDYHNVKAILKAEAMGVDSGHMLLDMGRVPAEILREAVKTGELDDLPPRLAAAISEAREVLDTTRDPQRCDMVLDRWCYLDMDDVAEATGSAFLHGYVRTQIDSANLRSLIRTLRMGKNTEFLRAALFSGGEVDEDAILKISTQQGSGLLELYGTTRFRSAAEAGAEALRGGSLTDFEKLCDDAVSDYLAGARMIPFGEAPLLAYLAARETEYTNVRILLMGRRAGIPAEVIRSRLRIGYV